MDSGETFFPMLWCHTKNVPRRTENLKYFMENDPQFKKDFDAAEVRTY
jgi:hypothetical protein